jgi:acyl-CoA reductase-like NAD-dependent aldehyde dehydrogenase
MMEAPVETPAALRARLDGALAARAQLRTRSLGDTVAALAAAAPRWAADAELHAALPAAARLSPEMVATVLPIAAEALEAGAMTELVERELGTGAARRPAPAGPGLIAHVLASNVPALALPAIALGCLAGAAVVVKSGRDDPLSAPAFVRALAAVDPDLAATVVTTYWPGGQTTGEEVVLAAADVVVATGGEAALAALAGRVRGRLIAHGPRMSVAAVDGEAAAEAVALDVALHDQRGCLSPHVVYVEAPQARVFAERLATALDRAADRLPLGPAGAEERAAVRVVRERAEWEPGVTVFATRGGTVVYDERLDCRSTCGRRTVRVHPLPSPAALAPLLPPGVVECVGLAGGAAPLVEALRARGVARVCPPGRMQRPPLTWPRGQQAPLGALLGYPGSPRLEVET